MNDTQAMNYLATYLSGREWNAETIETVANVIMQTGRPILEPEEYAARIEALEAEGLTTSDAQGVLQAEGMR